MQGVTRCIATLERDLFCVASTGVTMHTFPVVSPAAIMICFTCFTVDVLVSRFLTSTSGWLGNDHLITLSFALVPFESLEQAFLIFRRCPLLGDL